LEAGVEGLLVGKPGDLVLLLSLHQSFKMPLLAALNDRRGREPEVSESLESYFAMLLARVKAILIIKQ
jgi:hypothetical protein